eukprot:553056-Prymnesium_polylepis.1
MPLHHTAPFQSDQSAAQILEGRAFRHAQQGVPRRPPTHHPHGEHGAHSPFSRSHEDAMTTVSRAEEMRHAASSVLRAAIAVTSALSPAPPARPPCCVQSQSSKRTQAAVLGCAQLQSRGVTPCASISCLMAACATGVSRNLSQWFSPYASPCSSVFAVSSVPCHSSLRLTLRRRSRSAALAVLCT